jgi:hypothetical protein
MPSCPVVVGGVDTHKDIHVVVALDSLGRRLGDAVFPTTRDGNRQLLQWLRGHGEVHQVGIEGCGSYGAGWPAACEPRASRSSRSAAQTASFDAGAASPTSSMPRQQPVRCWPASTA